MAQETHGLECQQPQPLHIVHVGRSLLHPRPWYWDRASVHTSAISDHRSRQRIVTDPVPGTHVKLRCPKRLRAPPEGLAPRLGFSPQQLARDYNLHHLARAFENPQQSRITEQPLHGEFAHIAVATVNLHRPISNSP